MTAKEYLKKHREKQIEAKGIYRQIEKLRREAEGLGNMVPRDRVSGGIPREMADVVAHIVDLRRGLIKRLREVYKEQRLITEQIEALPDKEQEDLLRRRYITCDTWERIAVGMNVSWGTVHNIHPKALDSFTEIHREFLENL